MTLSRLTVADVTFAITAFERPGLLQKLVQSIRHHYPSAKIIVADNGRRKAALPNSVQVYDLPFDCGLSAARNFLASKVTTRTMLLLEEDFVFLPTTRIEPLLVVLQSDPEIGVVGGAMMGGNGRVSSFSMDIDIFRQTMFLHESRQGHRIASDGTPYRLCDVILNFALFRREMLLDHPWDETLKVGEHTPYYNEVKRERRWRVACCSQSVIFHVTEGRSKEYLAYRQRASRYFHDYLQQNGLEQCVRPQPHRFENSTPANPNVVVLGVGHSGTSILAKMLHASGWEAADADETFGESVSVRQMNQRAIRNGRLPDGAMRMLHRMPRPWAIKDPRFVDTLRHWMPLFANLDRPPMLVMIRREHDDVVASYRRRRARGDLDAMVADRQRRCEDYFARWPWSKLVIDYENIAKAVTLFRRPVVSAGRSATDRPAAEVMMRPSTLAMDSFAMSDGSPLTKASFDGSFADERHLTDDSGSFAQDFDGSDRFGFPTMLNQERDDSKLRDGSIAQDRDDGSG